MADGKVEIAVELDDGTVIKKVANIKDELGGIQKEVGGVGKGADGSSLSVGKLIKGFAAFEGVKKIAQGVGSALKQGFQFDAEVQTMKTGWSTILGGGKQAEDMVKRLNSYASHTPFNTADTDKMGKYLYNAGIEGDKMFDTMTSLGDTVSAYGGSAADAVEVTRQYAQVMQSGTAYTEDLNIANDRGIPIYQAIADQMGINVGEVKKMASQGKISSEIFAKAYETLGKDTKGSMDAMSQTWEGATSTFQDNFAMLSGMLVQPIFDVMTTSLNKLNDYMGSEGFQGKVQAIGDAFAAFVQDALPKVVDGFQTLMDILKVVAPYFPQIAATVMGLMVFIQVGQAVHTFTTAMKAAEAGTTGVKIAMDLLKISFLTNPFVLITAAVVAFGAALIYLWNTNDGFKQAVINAWNAILAFLQPVISAIQIFIQSTWESILIWWRQNQEEIKQAINLAWQFIQMIIQNVMTFLQPYIQNAWNGIKEIISAVWEAIKTVVQSAIRIIEGVIKVVTSAIRGDWSGVWDGIKQILSAAWDGMVAILKMQINVMWSTIKTIFNQIWQFVKDVFSGMGIDIEQALSDAAGWVSEKLDAIKGFFDSLGDIDLYQIGKDVIQGFINGIGDMGSWVKSTIDNLVGDVTGWLKGAFHIGSPSKLMRDEIGKWIPAGIGVGIEANADSALDSLNTVKAKLATSRESAMGIGGGMASVQGGGSTIGGATTINNNPVIHVAAEWYGEEDIRKTMQEINWLTTVDQRGAMA